MLIRTGVDEFSAPARDLVTIFARSRDNNDTNAASYRYNQAPLPSELVQNLPGCQFRVVPGAKVFKGQVAFDTAGAPTAAYDLFQLNNTGQDVPLNKTVLRSQNVQSGFFSFTITGTAAPTPKTKTRGKGEETTVKQAQSDSPRPSAEKVEEMIRLGSGLVLLVALGCATQAAAQTPESKAQDFWKAQAARIAALRKTVPTNLVQQVEELISVQNLLPNFLLYLDEQRRRDFDLRLVEDARTDKQVGSPASQPGGTNLVSKGSVPSIFGFAVENGALTPSQTGTVVTLRGGLIGWLDLVKNQGFIGAYERDSGFARALRRVSYSISLDTGTAVEKTETRPGLGAIKASLEDAGRQVAGYSMRVAIYDRRDPRRAENRAAANKLLSESQVLPSTDFLDEFFVKPEYRQWRETSAKILASPDLAEADVERVLFDRLEKVAQMMRAMLPEFEAQLTGVVLALDAYERARVAVFEAIHQRPVIAVEYVRARPVSLPDRSTIRFIAEGQFGAWDTTANAAWTYQHEGVVFVPDETTIEGYRDFQIAAQLERALGSVKDCIAKNTGIGRPVVGIAFLSQRLSETATITFAGHDYEVAPGWIHVLQARVTIPVKGSGVKIPLSVSFANRTELIEEKNVRAHVGLTFDLDVITAGFLKR